MLHIDHMGGISIWGVKRKMKMARALYANFLDPIVQYSTVQYSTVHEHRSSKSLHEKGLVRAFVGCMRVVVAGVAVKTCRGAEVHTILVRRAFCAFRCASEHKSKQRAGSRSRIYSWPVG